MTEKNKLTRVALLYGGKSGEHEISLLSAYSVLKNLDRKRYEVIPIGIDKQGNWFENSVGEIIHPTKHQLMIRGPHSTLIHQLDKNNHDVVFPMMHGPLYEDGCLQGLIQLMDIPYVGCAHLASALAMDKSISKRLAVAASIPVAPFMTITLQEWQKKPETLIDKVSTQLHFPVFVKPANLGSSVGTHKVKNTEQLNAAIHDALQYDHKILIEKAINAREIEVGLIENTEQPDQPFTSTIGEIIVNQKYEFYDYTAKYLDPKSIDLQIPAALSEQQTQLIKQYAQQAYAVLDCFGYARADFLVDKNNGDIYFSEINTIPGFTNMSMFPLMWNHSGLSYSDLLTKLIELALMRNQRQQSIKREWHLG